MYLLKQDIKNKRTVQTSNLGKLFQGWWSNTDSVEIKEKCLKCQVIKIANDRILFLFLGDNLIEIDTPSESV